MQIAKKKSQAQLTSELIRNLGSHDINVVEKARMALIKRGDGAVPELARKLHAKLGPTTIIEDNRVSESAYILGKIRTGKAIATLTDFVGNSDNDPHARRAAIGALEDVGSKAKSPKISPALLSVLKEKYPWFTSLFKSRARIAVERREQFDVQKAAATALGNIARPNNLGLADCAEAARLVGRLADKIKQPSKPVDTPFGPQYRSSGEAAAAGALNELYTAHYYLRTAKERRIKAPIRKK